MTEVSSAIYTNHTKDRNIQQMEVVEGPPRKRRRTAKPNADKKFECEHEGCGKSYSRAEHLYRHQLNHTPKTIYRCDFPDCNRYFVRQDLCVRHRERHSTQGSQLQKRDAFAQASVTQNDDGPSETTPETKTRSRRPTANERMSIDSENDPIDPIDPTLEDDNHNDQNCGDTAPVYPLSASGVTQGLHQQHPPPPTPQRQWSNTRAISSGQSSNPSIPFSPQRDQHTSTTSWPMNGEVRINHAQDVYPAGPAYSQSVAQSPLRSYSNSSVHTPQLAPYPSAVDVQYRAGQNNHDLSLGANIMTTNFINGLPSPGLQQNFQSVQTTYNVDPSPSSDSFAIPAMQAGAFDLTLTQSLGMPMLGGDQFGRSTFAYGNDLDWLFNNDNLTGQTLDFSPGNIMNPYSEPTMTQILEQDMPQISPMFTPYQQPAEIPPRMHPVKVNRALEVAMPLQNVMSEEKRQKILQLMRVQFVEKKHDAVKQRKEAVFEGDIDADEHILSLKMMHQYLGSYWYHQHAQLPILHKPTFYPDSTKTLLLMAVLAIGAATLDKAYGTSVTDSAAEFANFVIWHIRWEIMRHIDYRPPAKLWVFQTLLLIEVYEKMYATRALHERAHTHHDSTLTLMRRGSSLMGRSLSDSPQQSGKNGQAANSVAAATAAQHKSEESWIKWVTTEATRRAAFGAFVLDSIHCTMFGHSAKMVVHEMRLPLPCDEALWAATTPAEAARVQASLQNNGIKPTLFLEGLKKTMNGQRVHTNSFGRTTIMAGLLSISWHMTQRDLQLASIGPRAANSIGGADKWKSNLLRAFDNWKRDFDEALAEAATTPMSPDRFYDTEGHPILRPLDDENIFESRTVLHHLAHIAAHVDIVDCQVFAGANRLLDRFVTPRDFSLIKDKIVKWATRASARDSAFYAVKFIATVLIPPDEGQDGIDSRIYGHASPILPQAYDTNRRYIARDDFLLNRPWILYVSALVAWCYGYALEGPMDPPPRAEDFDTYEKREKDMRDYLSRVGGVEAPDDLEDVTGKNRLLGLLLILQESFESTRWELTRDAAGLLGNAAAKLRGSVPTTNSAVNGWLPQMQGQQATNGQY